MKMAETIIKNKNFNRNPQSGSYFHSFRIELEFGNVGFCGGRKTRVPGEKPSEQGREPTTNSTHTWRHLRHSNPATLGGSKCFHHCAIPVPLNCAYFCVYTHICVEPVYTLLCSSTSVHRQWKHALETPRKQSKRCFIFFFTLFSNGLQDTSPLFGQYLYAYAQPYRPGSDSYGHLFRPC